MFGRARSRASVGALVGMLVGTSGCPGARGPEDSSRGSPCVAFAAEQRVLVRAARARFGDDVPWSSTFGACFSAGSGAFGISVDAVEEAPNLRGRWSLVHLDAVGGRVAVGPRVPTVIELLHPLLPPLPPPLPPPASTEGPLSKAPTDNLRRGVVLDPPALFDLDGDGEAELFLRVSLTLPDGEVWASGHVWTFRQGVLEKYAPSAALAGEAMRDVDGDGRLDLLTHGAFVGIGRLDAAQGAFQRLYGPLFLAHGDGHGGFTFADDVARQFARGVCPARPAPASLVVWVNAAPRTLDDARTAVNVACARTWGMSARVARSALEAACRDSHDPCLNAEALAVLAEGAPPLALP